MNREPTPSPVRSPVRFLKLCLQPPERLHIHHRKSSQRAARRPSSPRALAPPGYLQHLRAPMTSVLRAFRRPPPRRVSQQPLPTRTTTSAPARLPATSAPAHHDLDLHTPQRTATVQKPGDPHQRRALLGSLDLHTTDAPSLDDCSDMIGAPQPSSCSADTELLVF